MLYDPKWEKPVETQIDPFLLGSLIAWLEQQPAQKTYRYTDPRNCLLCQYFTAHGFSEVHVTMNNMRHSLGEIEFPRTFSWDVSNAYPQDSTFGAALERARALR